MALALLQANASDPAASARIEAVLGVWGSCAMGEAARLTLSAMPIGEIADAAFELCSDIESFARAEIARSQAWNQDGLFDAHKRIFRLSIEEIAATRRSALAPQGVAGL